MGGEECGKGRRMRGARVREGGRRMREERRENERGEEGG